MVGRDRFGGLYQALNRSDYFFLNEELDYVLDEPRFIQFLDFEYDGDPAGLTDEELIKAVTVLIAQQNEFLRVLQSRTPEERISELEYDIKGKSEIRKKLGKAYTILGKLRRNYKRFHSDEDTKAIQKWESEYSKLDLDYTTDYLQYIKEDKALQEQEKNFSETDPERERIVEQRMLLMERFQER